MEGGGAKTWHLSAPSSSPLSSRRLSRCRAGGDKPPSSLLRQLFSWYRKTEKLSIVGQDFLGWPSFSIPFYSMSFTHRNTHKHSHTQPQYITSSPGAGSSLSLNPALMPTLCSLTHLCCLHYNWCTASFSC